MDHRAARRPQRALLPRRDPRLPARRGDGRPHRAPLANVFARCCSRAGLLSKASVMTLPAVLVLLDVYPLRRGALTWRRLVVEKAGYWALARRRRGGGAGRAPAIRAEDHPVRGLRPRSPHRHDGLQPLVLSRHVGLARPPLAHVRAPGPARPARAEIPAAGPRARRGHRPARASAEAMAGRPGRLGVLRRDAPADQRRRACRLPAGPRSVQLPVGARLRAPGRRRDRLDPGGGRGSASEPPGGGRGRSRRRPS